VATTDGIVLGLEKPKIHMSNQAITRYLKFGYYADSQMHSPFIKTTDGTTANREMYVIDGDDVVPGIILRANGFKGAATGD